MKKSVKQEKKLSLKKLQIMKINDMKVIKGGLNLGNNGSMVIDNDGDDDQTPTPLRNTHVK
ncbi:hypothetical protein C1631_020770 [Chryseobacterium phosphatilyticum]|uniref:Uncharacterized protein n=1 Tax=Chryseobacterium phosphatilyticum TaxID=475075 RepID=A0A316WXT4_9FLAO|nr:hypothetical protein [Chryseobacterium phosphatilyticum]PWN65043.1 hypothetical protein C1631_020770 [Chryseobacterium phosphatilyticum]